MENGVKVWWMRLDCVKRIFDVSSLRKTSPLLSMSVLKLNPTDFSCIF
jgi:hypothetical protein